MNTTQARVVLLIAVAISNITYAVHSSAQSSSSTDLVATAVQDQEPAVGQAQEAPPLPPHPAKPEFEIYGFAMLDMGYDFGQINPDWFDVERPTKLPAFRNEFGHNG